ncbi:MAG: AAA family ATPase [Bacteroidota bacterium]
MALSQQISIRPEVFEIIKKSLTDVKTGKGKIFCVGGETGTGKTHLLKELKSEVAENFTDITTLIVEGQSPIGSFNIGTLQPLLPFSRAVEKLLHYDNEEASAEKKFAKNIGLTVLASIPGVGDVFYAVKELGRDWRQYKKDKSSSSIRNISTGTADYFDTICMFADKKPLLIMFDDFHWCDAQSLELLNLFHDKVSSIPLVIVCTFRKSVLISKGLPLLSFIQRQKTNSHTLQMQELQGFSKAETSLVCKSFFTGYKPSSKFENWLFKQSMGVPGVLFEYLKYFKSNSPFLPDGSLDENFDSRSFLPTTVHSAFSQILDKLSDEERNALAVCSSEGREFTAIIISQLLNTDILTAIKKLRALQNKTGIVRSLGSQVRYGVKTTTYEFTQAFYHSFFENSLEYEEHIALHGQIAAVLRQKYDEAESEALKQQIAPYLAAHSAEAGDESTAKSMLLLAAQAAQRYGNTEVIQDMYESYANIGSKTSEETENQNEEIAFADLIRASKHNVVPDSEEADTALSEETGETVHESIEQPAQDFGIIRKTIVDYYLKKNFSSAAELAITYYNSNEVSLHSSEKIQLLSLTVKSLIELKDYHRAEKFVEDAKNMLNDKTDILAECLYYNAVSALQVSKNNYSEALNNLRQAAEKSINLPSELRLLTLSNIAIITEINDSAEANRYYDAVRKLSSALDFEDFARDVF